MAANSNSEVPLFLDIDTPLFQDGFLDNSSDISTAESVAIEDEEFIVDAIIADKPDPCAPETSLYLVKWSMYPVSRCTWEPATSFTDPETVTDYLSRKSQGRVVPFDWENWDKERACEKEEKEKRKEKRAKKRGKAGLNKPEAPRPKQRLSPTAGRRMLARLHKDSPFAEEGEAVGGVEERSPVKKRMPARRREGSPAADEEEAPKVKKNRLAPGVGERILAGGSPVAGGGEASKKVKKGRLVRRN